MNRTILCGALLSAAVFAPLGWAQTSPLPIALAALLAPDPLDARAPVPAPNFRSSLSDYRPSKPTEVGPWRQLNDRVHEAGGWKAYARLSQEADEPEAAKQPQRAPASSPAHAGDTQDPGQKPASSGHAGHAH